MASWTTYQIILALGMVVTGSINTLATKWADSTPSEGRDGVVRNFDHPFLQACGMFIGEFSCLVTFKIMYYWKRRKGTPMDIGEQNFSPLIFLPPAMCDMMGTSLMYVGLTLTYASSFQMLRGAIIIFTGLLSVAFLNRVLKAYQWLGMLLVILGLTVVGSSDLLFGNIDSHDANGVLSGDLLIIMAQIIGATQMVIEEKFVGKYNVPPLQAVGWEGFFGFCTLSFLLIPMYYIHIGPPFSSSPEGRLEDAIDGFYQLANNNIVMLATFGNIVSIAFFNFCGISVTKEISATTRMVLDSVRTLVIWFVSLAAGWQGFQYLQLIGFMLLVIGMAVYEHILSITCIKEKCGGSRNTQLEPVENGINSSDDDRKALLPPNDDAKPSYGVA